MTDSELHSPGSVGPDARWRAATHRGAPLLLLGYAVVAGAFAWWPSMIGSTIVAWLLWRQHPRARFAAYVFLSILTARAGLTGSWPLALFAVAFIGLLQLPVARSVWPRLTWGRPLR